MGNSINIRVAKYQVLDSGTVLSHENSEILFEIKNLNIKICFRQDEQNKGHTVTAEMTADHSCLQLTLTNFENPLGTGLVTPIEIGAIDGNRLCLLFMVHALGDSKTHQFSYTWLISKEK